jgi:hypothetical protein
MHQELQKAGFKARGSTWYKQNKETILVVNLQKSQWGPQFYINLAVWVRQLGDEPSPRESICHIRARATSLPSGSAKQLGQALNLEDESMSMERREALIAGFMRQEALPFLESLSTLEGIQSVLEQQRLKGCFISGPLEEMLAHRSKRPL